MPCTSQKNGHPTTPDKAAEAFQSIGVHCPAAECRGQANPVGRRIFNNKRRTAGRCNHGQKLRWRKYGFWLHTFPTGRRRGCWWIVLDSRLLHFFTPTSENQPAPALWFHRGALTRRLILRFLNGGV